MSHQGPLSLQSSQSSSSEKGIKISNAPWGKWTDDLVAKLIKLFKEKNSTSEMADELGISRNSVCGKLHRMGLDRGGENISKHPKAAKGGRNQSRLRVARPSGPDGPQRRSETRKIALIPLFNREPLKLRAVLIEPRNLTLEDRGSDDCCYPYGDGPFLYCGHPKLKGSSYCAPHHALVWVPPRGRQ